MFIESTGTIMQVGGITSAATNDVLMSTPQGWQVQSQARPPARYLTAMVYDRQRRVVVLFGGGNDTGLLDDTWEWDGTSWRAR